MASVKDFIEAGNEYKRQVAASNTIITTKPPAIWFQEIADKLQLDMALSELTLEYNLSLVDGEEPMSEKEMAEILEVSEVAKQNRPAFASGDYGSAFVQAEQEAMQKPKYSEWDMMLKDDEIARLKQRIDYLERHLNTLRAQGYGVNWKAIREAMENESEREAPRSM